jgi:hypothetical protein
MRDVIDEIIDVIVSGGVAKRSQIKGCSEAEIEKIEKHFDVKLPVVYCSFLTKMGKGAGKYLQGVDAFYADLFDNREQLEYALEFGAEPIELRRTHFVMTDLQGYYFEYFDTVDDPIDPPVFGCGEREGKWEVIHVAASLSEYFRKKADTWLYVVNYTPRRTLRDKGGA